MRSSEKDRDSRKNRNESALDEINSVNDRIRSKRQQVDTRKQDLDRLINDRRYISIWWNNYSYIHWCINL